MRNVRSGHYGLRRCVFIHVCEGVVVNTLPVNMWTREQCDCEWWGVSVQPFLSVDFFLQASKVNTNCWAPQTAHTQIFIHVQLGVLQVVYLCVSESFNSEVMDSEGSSLRWVYFCSNTDLVWLYKLTVFNKHVHSHIQHPLGYLSFCTRLSMLKKWMCHCSQKC